MICTFWNELLRIIICGFVVGLPWPLGICLQQFIQYLIHVRALFWIFLCNFSDLSIPFLLIGMNFAPEQRECVISDSF